MAAKTKGGKPSTGSSKPNDFTKDQDLQAYEDMLLIRRFEEKAGQLYGMGLIGGFCHLYIGQEAVVTGMQMCIREGEDQVLTSYRDHGHMIACGMDPNGVMAELTGRMGAMKASTWHRCGSFPSSSLSKTTIMQWVHLLADHQRKQNLLSAAKPLIFQA